MLISDVLDRKGRQVTTMLPTESVSRAVELLAERRIGAVVVEDRWQRLAGIFSERDLVRLLARSGPAILDQPVESAMTHNVITCHPGDRIDDILGIMTMNKFRHVPVLQNGRLAGIVSIGDLVHYRLNETEQEAAVLLDISRMRA